MNNDASKPRHPIRVVSHRTGLTPATIRAWERRYHAVEPARSEGGQRLYSDEDIDRLVTLRRLTDMGRSIGTVASLPDEMAEALLTEDLQATPPAPASQVADGGTGSWIEDAYRHMLAMDAESLERALWRAFLSLGAKAFLEGVAAPLLSRVGAAWAAGQVSSGQEHMASGVLERVLTWINDPSMSASDGPPVVVATLPGERHALGARLAAAAAAVEGWRPTYLGADLPVEEIASAAKEVGATRVAISAVRTEQPDKTAADLIELRTLLDPNVVIMVGGAGAASLAGRHLPHGIEIFDSLGAFAQVRSNGQRASAAT